MSENTIKVLLLEPMKKPKLVEIGVDLESMQKAVEGYIEEIMPFEDEVAIVCNEEGKMNGLELNRAIYAENGEIIDIIAGKFFVCSAPFESENFESLTDEQQKKYGDKFKYPEQFFKTNDGIKAVPLVQNKKDFER